jgi:hypothetical protein
MNVHKLVKREVLVRSSKFLEEYRSDKPMQLIHEITTLLYRSYKLKKMNLQTELDFHIFESQGISGFYFNNRKYSKKALQIIQEFMKDSVCAQGYHVSLADVTISTNDYGIKKIERYYLKPIYEINGHDKRVQKFGNISIEIHDLNEYPQYFKLTTAIYHDNHFQIAQSFDELMQALFD